MYKRQPSTQHILFIGQTSAAKEQSKTIPDMFNKLGMHYGWLGKRAVLYVDDTTSDWMKLKDSKKHYNEFRQFSKERGMTHPDALAEYAKKMCIRDSHRTGREQRRRPQ